MYAEALESAGYERMISAGTQGLKFAFYDHDVGPGGMGHRNGLDYLYHAGVPVFLYPHAARPMLQWDGMYNVWPHTVCNFVIAEGHAEVMESYGYPIPIEICGWNLCDLKDFEPISPVKPIKVLFAPIHPNGNGWLHEMDMRLNVQTYKLLLETPGIELTVRHIKRLDLNGLWPADGVNFVLGKANGCHAEIDEADIVIAHQTFAYISAARGKPLVMFGEQVTPHSGNRPENFRFVGSWPQYRDLMQYPVEFENAESGLHLRSMMAEAMESDLGADWRARFIGKVFDGPRFVEMVEGWL